MDFSIVKAGINDCEQIKEIAFPVWYDTYKNILSPEQLDYMFDMMYSVENLKKQILELKHQFFIAFADNKPSGYISIEKTEEDVFIVQKIYILPEMQGKGFGRYVLNKGIEYVKGIHHEPFTLKLYVNRKNPAVGFYKHFGMEIVDNRDFHIGNDFYMNDYIMAMSIV
jgi:GNAT superfamily N-acetyltransferase